MIRVMRDTAVAHDRRDRMAAAAAPYVHPRLTGTTVAGDTGGAVRVVVAKDVAEGC